MNDANDHLRIGNCQSCDQHGKRYKHGDNWLCSNCWETWDLDQKDKRIAELEVEIVRLNDCQIIAYVEGVKAEVERLKAVVDAIDGIEFKVRNRQEQRAVDRYVKARAAIDAKEASDE